MTYVPALDGMRALACVAVILCHAFPTICIGGGYGVDVFFVLSGFLITGILLDDIEKRGRICFKSFYLRRARRLFPALFVMLVMTMILWVFVWKRPGFPTAAGAVAGYYANWFIVHHASGRGLGLMPHAWSLSIEEQFYLFWPLLLLALVYQKRGAFIGTVILRIAVLLTVARAAFYFLNSPLAHPCSTLARMDGLLVGCACAAFLRYRPSVARFWAGRTGTVVAASCGIALIVSVFFAPAHSIVPLLLLGSVLVAGYSAAIILYAASGGKSRCLEHPWLIAVGKRSYGLYLYHVPIFYAFPNQPVVILIAAAFGVAWLSYRYVERPLLGTARWTDSAAVLLNDSTVPPAPTGSAAS